ncbi:M23 family metallopeptidase [Paraburkholderia sp. J76]|uniref:M23 family metallopeptidase n=1 Tax=Paraburkholderia sp. J76 TaxID=2805439 RepID=UPI002ABE8E86|nr:M23 family metallopeptidase [Paraburkholderia sp. J76]
MGPVFRMPQGRFRVIIACAAAVFALATGFATGRLTSAYSSTPRTGADAMANERHATTGAIGRSTAANASLDTRIARLSGQLAALDQFDQRMRAQPPRGTAGEITLAAARPHDGADANTDAKGGPELGPRKCLDASTARANATPGDDEYDCVSATLSALEQATAEHEAAWRAYPGRRPISGGRDGSPFGNRIDPFTHRMSFHPGIDLVAPAGTPIFAAASGRVVFAGPKAGYGNAVEIDHGNGFVTRYGHASKIDVRVGQIVQPHEHIADVGTTGRSTGPHLHFEVLVAGRAVDPAAYLALFAAPLDAGLTPHGQDA